MGAKAKHPTRARAGRVTSKKAGKKAGAKKHRLYPESVPPAMVAEVFDVSGADEEELSPSIPPPPPMHDAPPRFVSSPLLSRPPTPPRPSLPPADEDALELGEEELEPDEDGSGLRDDHGVPLLTPPPTLARTPVKRSGAMAWVAIGAAALALGLVLGGRMRTQEPMHSLAARRVEPPPVTPVATATEIAAAVAASAAPEGTLDVDAVPSALPELNASSVTPPSASASARAAQSPAKPRVSDDSPPFDAQAAADAINAAFARAGTCRGAADPTGEVTATLKYAPSGRVTTATVSGVFAGTPIGGCIASTLRGARVPPFSGDYLTVKRTAFLK
jgi:hypothetical protein